MPRDIALGMMQHSRVRAYAQPPDTLVRSKYICPIWDRRRKQRWRWIRLLDNNSRSKAEHGEELGSLVLAVDCLAERHSIALEYDSFVSKKWHCRLPNATIVWFKYDKKVICSLAHESDYNWKQLCSTPRTRWLSKRLRYVSNNFFCS
jgi:hypothetical protein